MFDSGSLIRGTHCNLHLAQNCKDSICASESVRLSENPRMILIIHSDPSF